MNGKPHESCHGLIFSMELSSTLYKAALLIILLLIQAVDSAAYSSTAMMNDLVRIRAITAFITLTPNDLEDSIQLREKVGKAKETLTSVQHDLQASGYEVQTVRIATNPFGEYLETASVRIPGEPTLLRSQLDQLNSILAENEVDFFAIGPAQSVDEVDACPFIASSSHRISCSAALQSGNDIKMAKKAAECMKRISKLGSIVEGDHVKDGLGNFRFCATANCKPFTPYFPAAMGPSMHAMNNQESKEVPFSIGLENGKLAREILERCGQIDQIETRFKSEMADALSPIQKICEKVSTKKVKSVFKGIDTSLNPSLDDNGSVAEAIELIDSVQQFGGPGCISVAAEITKALKTLPDIKKVGYCGLMLPVCEDRRLAQLASSHEIDTTRLLAISSVCGVGLDTIPVPDCGEEKLTSLILDVGALSFRYEKSLSCRLLICPGTVGGDQTRFNSPYMCECKIFKL